MFHVIQNVHNLVKFHGIFQGKFLFHATPGFILVSKKIFDIYDYFSQIIFKENKKKRKQEKKLKKTKTKNPAFVNFYGLEKNKRNVKLLAF